MGRGRTQYREGYALDDFVTGEDGEIDEDAVSASEAETKDEFDQELIADEPLTNATKGVSNGNKTGKPIEKVKADAELLDEMIGPETDEDETFSQTDDQSDFSAPSDLDEDEDYESEASDYESDHSVRNKKKGNAFKAKPRAAKATAKANTATTQAKATTNTNSTTPACNSVDTGSATNTTKKRANASFTSSKSMLAPPPADAPPKQRPPPVVEEKPKRENAGNHQLNMAVTKPKQSRNPAQKGTIKPKKETKPSPVVDTDEPAEGTTRSETAIELPISDLPRSKEPTPLHKQPIPDATPALLVEDKLTPTREHTVDEAFQTLPSPPPVATDIAPPAQPPANTPSSVQPTTLAKKESMYNRLKRGFGMFKVDKNGMAKPNQSDTSGANREEGDDGDYDDSPTLKAAKLDWGQYYV